MFMSPQNLCVEILNVMVFGSAAFGMCLGHEGGVPINAIGAFIKDTPESLLAFFYHIRIQREVCNPKEGPHLTMLAP